MSLVRLNGQIRCRTEAGILRRHLPEHIALTLDEAGCLSFSVTPEGQLSWRVAEVFADEDAFAAHQRRTAASDWGRATAGFARDYVITKDA